MVGGELIDVIIPFLKGISNFNKREIETFAILIAGFSVIPDGKKSEFYPLIETLIEVAVQMAEGVSIETAIKSLTPVLKLN